MSRIFHVEFMFHLDRGEIPGLPSNPRLFQEKSFVIVADDDGVSTLFRNDGRELGGECLIGSIVNVKEEGRETEGRIQCTFYRSLDNHAKIYYLQPQPFSHALLLVRAFYDAGKLSDEAVESFVSVLGI